MGYQEDILCVASQRLPWEKLDGGNILITGATGLIGSCLVEVLMGHPKKTYNVYVSGRNLNRARGLFEKYKKDQTFHFIQYDVTHPLECDISFHYIIHAASNASPNFFASKPVEVMKANINGVINLMEYGLTHELRRFLFVSSGEVYGEGDGRIFTEDYSGYVDCTSPRSCYPTSKRAAESLCMSYAQEYGVEVVIARPSHTYGPHFTESDNRVYAQFIRNVQRDEDIVMKSSGEQFRSWCYVVDCVSGILYVLLKGRNGQAYNIADENSNITIKALAEMIAKMGNRKVVIEIPSEMEKSGYNMVKKSVFNIDKLMGLGWNPLRYNMCENMEHTIKEYERYNLKALL